MAKQVEDFWNSSSHSGFCFDDIEEDTLSQISNEDVVFHSTSEESAELPINAIISKICLDLVLDDIKSTIDMFVPPVEETIKKMVNGHKYTLNVYIKFQDKISLLDNAIETCDGNIIIKVLLFLKSTLKPNIFYHQLIKRKSAARHFSFYLMTSHRFEELADLYMATGKSSNMKEIFYFAGHGIEDREMLLKKLEHFKLQHLQKTTLNDENWEINEHMDFIKFQIDTKSRANSVVEQLTELCREEICGGLQNCLKRLQDFKKLFKIDDFTFDWILMNVMASMQLWDHLSDVFLKSNWLSKRNSLKSSISLEVLLNGLNRHHPPKDLLEKFVECISDSDRALYWALKLECHQFAILHYVKERDRLALINYKSKVLPETTTEYYLIDSFLQSTEKKWKN